MRRLGRASIMPEFIQHADRVLRAAGILPGSPLAVELLDLLSERARDWAETAVAHGGLIDAGTATHVAAKALASDRELRSRLEQLEITAVEVFLNFLGSADERDAPSPPDASVRGRRRRRGGDAQPQGIAARNPYAKPEGSQMASTGRVMPVADLIGLPIYGSTGKVLGVVKGVTVATSNGAPTGIVADDIRRGIVSRNALPGHR
jgi:hypothetical protein